MAARKKPQRPPSRKARQKATQTKRREILIARVENEYEKELRRREAQIQNLIDKWIAKNSKEALQDAGEEELIRQIRGLFKDPRNVRAFFGRIASLIEDDTFAVFRPLVPTVGRESVVSPSLLRKFGESNASLITSVPNVAADRLSEIIRGGAGRKGATLQREIQQTFSVSRNKAKFWARDQTLKMHADITQARHRSLGIDRYYWTDSNDERVRDIHGDLGARSDAGETFAYKDPPVISEDGRRGNPGEDFNCRCTAYPVLT